MKNAKIKSLYTAVAFGLSTMVCQSAQADDSYKKIGDLEIYKAAEEGKVTIMMMLDTSGSMSAPIMRRDFGDGGSACELSVGNAYTPSTKEYVDPAGTGFKFIEHYCQPGGPGSAVSQKQYVYFYIPSQPVTRTETKYVTNWSYDRWGRRIETTVPTTTTTTTQYEERYYRCLNVNNCNDGNRDGPYKGKPSGYNNYEKETINVTFTGAHAPGKGEFLTEVRVTKPATPLSGQPVEDRLTRLKKAMFALMNSQDLDSKKVAIGIGQFSSQENGQGDGRTGRILVPAALLDEAQRNKIKEAVAKLEGHNGTPASQAFAEAGAYMLGTTTKGGRYRETDGYLYETPSGFDKSVAESKSGSNYISPLKENAPKCDGQGIYFLTDGEPNSSLAPETIMKIALGNKGSNFSVPTPGQGTLPNGGSNNHGMPAAGTFAKALRDAKTNPKGVSIRTAVVGFGSVFDTSKYTDEKDITKNILRSFDKPQLDETTKLPIEGKFKEGEKAVYVNCNLITAIDAKNACNWGAKSHPELPGVGGYGEGGFYSAQSTDDVIQSVKTFLGDLTQTISSAPAGTISVPADPLNSLTIQPFAYLPMMHPNVAGAPAIWQGNLRKYHTLFGTLYGRDGATRLYITSANPTVGNAKFPSATNPNALDLWQDKDSTASAASVEVGGSRSHLVAAEKEGEPNLKNKTSRVVYVEGGSPEKPVMVKVQVVNHALTISDPTQLAARKYTIEDLAYLADYLGFPVLNHADIQEKINQAKQLRRNVEDAKRAGDQAKLAEAQAKLDSYQTELEKNLSSDIPTLTEAIKSTEMRASPVFGGVNHSVPVLASYEGFYDDKTGNISTHPDKRTDYLLYGSMDGALHMTDARSGQENFSFIPRVMFDNQREALADGSSNNRTGQPYFGVDAPWATKGTYNYTNTDKVTVDTMMAYGGLRMGGKGFYGLNLKSATTPELAFAISDKTPNFERLGQTWAKPTFTKIKFGPGPRDHKEVIVFGGGYDMCYENPKFTLNDTKNTDASCANKTQAEGNAIYMVDAQTGAFIARWQANPAVAGGVTTINDDRNEMKHSFVSEIVALDRNNNGFVDSLYASDLGGQLFRIDIKEGVSADKMTRRVVRVFDANADANLGEGVPPLRFYEKPLVSFYDNDGTMAMVSIASGDRSSPLHTHRDSPEKANRIYGIIDRDLPTFRISQNGNDQLVSRNLNHSHLHAYNTAEIASASNEKRANLIKALKNKAGTPTDKTKDGAKQGWWYSMTRFESYTDVKHLKAIGSSVVMGGIYYTSIYSPDYQYTTTDSCSAKLVGATERQMFCMPWGICAADKDDGSKGVKAGQLLGGSKNGTFGYSKAGPGIQELGMATVTAETNTSTNFKTIIGMQTIVERTQTNPDAPPAPGGNSPSPAMVDGSGTKGNSSTDVVNESGKNNLPNTKTILKIDRWYDLATAEANQ